MFKGAILGFLVGKIFFWLVPFKEFFRDCLGENYNFFGTTIFVLVSIMIISMISLKKGDVKNGD